MKKPFIVCLCSLTFILTACSNEQAAENTEAAKTEEKKTAHKIVSLNGSLTEILCLAEQEKNIVGVDVTSTFPESINQVPKVGHTRNLQAEGIIALNPTLVLGIEEDIKPELAEQLKKAKIEVVLYKRDYSVEGAQQLIKAVCETVGQAEKAEALGTKISNDMKAVTALSTKPKVLFIYARGAGTLMVAGDNTPMKTMIELAGGENAATGFDDFKPLSPESLLESNPDIILMFSSGIESIEGETGLLKLPGVAQTNAGKNKAVVAMDGQYLSGFGPRMGQAVAELNTRLKEWADKKQTAKK